MSDKFKVIDSATFAKLQESSSSNATGTKTIPKIRNSKYKRMNASNTFDLLQFVNKAKQRGKLKTDDGFKVKQKVHRKRIVDTKIAAPKKKGKRREDGRKKPTRLKRSILQYRQKKREQATLSKELKESIDKFMKLELKDEVNNNVGSKKEEKKSIHSNSFRDYCNCCTTPDLRKHCEKLIRELNHFQRRAYAQNQIKARAHKRFVVGFRQVQSYLNINKLKLVIIATDCEHNEGDVSLDEIIGNIKCKCNDQQIPVVFAFKRREMAYFLYKKGTIISCIGILDYDGARETFSYTIEALKNAQDMYESLTSKS
ncbi:SECIS-binding protein 2 [Cochliomyia hominivorax]